MTGLVIRSTGSWYVVRTDDGQLFDCKVKGSFRLRDIKSTNPIAVGDFVDILPKPDGTALVTDIRSRRNYIIRKASNLSKQCHIIASNVDQALLVVTVAHPETSTTFVDRFLATAEAYRIPVIIVFNKTDLYSEEDTRYMLELKKLYENLRYQCHAVSAISGVLPEALTNSLLGKTTLLSGNSGVGKSTLLNTLSPGAGARTAAISAAHDLGRHVTTLSEMYDLPFGGCLIDTPGIKGFGTFDMKKEEISHYFREIFQTSSACRFNDCTHTNEPGCAVLQAVEEGRIALCRYTSYLSMLDERSDEKYRLAQKDL
ncbi:MAG: ribosome small subunit-dependent GTPase A [Prevotellaceae bacterium]|nr:ribosome small subunit-dependent GTPase A [Prevotellaceae bacterium]